MVEDSEYLYEPDLIRSDVVSDSGYGYENMNGLSTRGQRGRILLRNKMPCIHVSYLDEEKTEVRGPPCLFVCLFRWFLPTEDCDYLLTGRGR